MQPKTIKIDNIEYVQKDSIKQKAENVDGMECVMIRTYSAGVHYGYLKSRNGKEVKLVNSKRVWSWSGACSLSQLAVDGSNNHSGCKITMQLPNIILTEAIEIIPMTKKAIDDLNSIETWKKK